MARKDLAGLAALGALGMMLSKRKGADRDTDTGVDVMPSYAAKKELKEVPFKGMPVSSSDALPAYLAKQANRIGGGKSEITDVYAEDNSPNFKKNEFGEVYGAVPEGRLKAYQDRQDLINRNVNNPGYSAGMKKGGAVKKMASGGMASSASKRADGIAQKGKTRGKMC
jgi:hypothetical protein